MKSKDDIESARIIAEAHGLTVMDEARTLKSFQDEVTKEAERLIATPLNDLASRLSALESRVLLLEHSADLASAPKRDWRTTSTEGVEPEWFAPGGQTG